jgi:DNA-binding MarR family transcriptional regulator
MQSLGKERPELDERAAAEPLERELERLTRFTAHVLRHRPGLTVAPVLVRVSEAGPQRLGEIAAAVGSDPSTVSRQVNALVAAGLVERRADPYDSRAQLLEATPTGAQRCADARERWKHLLAVVLAGWSADLRLRLAELLGHLADDLHESDRFPGRSGGKG